MQKLVLVVAVAAASLVCCGCETVGLNAAVGFNVDGWHVGLTLHPLVWQETDSPASSATTRP
jgi:hypothetical protein